MEIYNVVKPVGYGSGSTLDEVQIGQYRYEPNGVAYYEGNEADATGYVKLIGDSGVIHRMVPHQIIEQAIEDGSIIIMTEDRSSPDAP